MNTPAYDAGFFEGQRTGSPQIGVEDRTNSSRVAVAPISHRRGVWGRHLVEVFLELGVEEALGLDGAYVKQSDLAIPAHCFRPVDLTKGVDLGNRFDLAISLEVAEHLPPALGPSFVQTLTNLAPCVLFSAAIPFQGGHGHVNERWPDYWADLFEAEGFCSVDCIRERVWDDTDVEFFYAQNTILYVLRSIVESSGPEFGSLVARHSGRPARLVHPDLYLMWASRDPTLGVIAKGLLPAVRASVVHRLRPTDPALTRSERGWGRRETAGLTCASRPTSVRPGSCCRGAFRQLALGVPHRPTQSQY